MRNRHILNVFQAWVPEILASTMNLIGKWEEEIQGRIEVEVEMHKELHDLSAEIISRTAFGSSFKEGKRIFELQERQIRLTLQATRTIYIPSSRSLSFFTPCFIDQILA